MGTLASKSPSSKQLSCGISHLYTSIKLLLSMPNERPHVSKEMEALLEEGFSNETIKVLEEAGYDWDLLPFIQEEDLESLFPKRLGDRQRIRLFLQKWKVSDNMSWMME